MLYMLQWLVPLHLQPMGLHEMLYVVQIFRIFCLSLRKNRKSGHSMADVKTTAA